MPALFGDIRLAARLLLKDKWFTLAAVAALALGIAANSTVFTIVNGVLLRDLPFEDPGRIVAVGVKTGPSAQEPLSGVSYADARDWQQAARAFDGVGIFSEQAMNIADETNAPERVLGSFIYTQQWAQRVFGSMFGMFGAIALILATVGLYAVTAYSVAQRTREIGVRVALGAQARHVGWLVTRGASWQIAAGLTVGMAGSVFVSRAVPVAITRVDGTDPITFGAVIALLVGVALIACLIPGRRAMRLNPVDALRSE